MNVGRTSVLLLLLVSGTACLGPRALAESIHSRESRLIVLPFDDFSGSEKAAAQLRVEVVKAVEARGWQVVDSSTVETLLEKERVRYFDSLEDPVRVRILESAGASAVVSGAVHTFSRGRIPVVALSARMVRATGAVVWGDVAGLSSDDTEGAFGFGRQSSTEAVGQIAVGRLMRDFPAPGERQNRVGTREKPRFRSSPHVYTSPLSDKGRIRVCVLPFVNHSKAPEAAFIVGEILALRLAEAPGFEVVEPAALRAAALAARIGTFRSATTGHLSKLGDAVGTPFFIIGSVFDYSDSSGLRGTTPELEIEFSMIDVRSGRIVWTTQHGGKGTDYTGFLMLGTVSNVVTLADRIVCEMIHSGERGLSREARPPAAQRARLFERPERRSQLDEPPHKENQ